MKWHRDNLAVYCKNMMATGDPVKLPAFFFQQFYDLATIHTIMIYLI